MLSPATLSSSHPDRQGVSSYESLVIYIPPYLAIHGIHLAEVPLAHLTIQVISKGW